MRSLEDVQAWRGMTMVDADGAKLGTVEDVYLDRQTGEPEWVTVRTGLFGRKRSFVPIRYAEPTGEEEIRVPVGKEVVKDAPKIEPDGELSPEEERTLYEHYGRADYGEWRGEDRTTALAPTTDEPADEPAGDARAGGPAIVGVRLRRVIVVAAPVGDRTDAGDRA
jgi:sporulation protein YlmC with PRC-barrel domain